jgi:hypothetical protein
MGIPAWRHVDLLPILAAKRDDRDDDEDDNHDDQAFSLSRLEDDAPTGPSAFTPGDNRYDTRVFGESRFSP